MSTAMQVKDPGAPFKMSDVSMLHVKIDPMTSKVVAGGPPSCWQCSRMLLDSQIRGIWLYETIGVGEWKFYPPDEFHRETLYNCSKGPGESDMYTPADEAFLLKGQK
jgi:hypothetical protein